jgi:WD40 repeat protein
MRVFEVGDNVVLLRFLPDGRRLVIGTMAADEAVTFAVLSLPGGERVRLDVPNAKIHSWRHDAWYGNAIAVHPSGESCYIAWGARLHAFRTTGGQSLRVPKDMRGNVNQVALSPSGDRLLAADRTRAGHLLWAVTAGRRGGKVEWFRVLDAGFSQLAGFLPDGERFVTIEDVVRIRSLTTNAELAAGRHKAVGSQQPQISPDGRLLAAIGYRGVDIWDLTTLDEPQKIGGSTSFGDFRSFALHPNGRTVAVIHGGPTLVQVHDLGTLTQVHQWSWGLGPLRSVAYSPDGTVAAAGSEDGRIVVWDVDE